MQRPIPLIFLQSLWSAPTSLVGGMLFLCALPTGARCRLHSGVLECHGGLITWLLENATTLPGGALAMTLGEVVIALSPAAHDVTRSHERIHVQQCRRWGPLFLPAYLTASALAYAKGKHPYRDNPFEIEAYTKDGRNRR